MTIKNLTSILTPYRQALESITPKLRWRLNLQRSISNNVGFSKKAVADIYQPASQHNDFNLSYAIEFADQKIAYGSLNPLQTSPQEMLALAKSIAMTSDDTLPLPPTPISSQLPNLVAPGGFPDDLLSQMLPQATQIRDHLLAIEPKSFEGEISGSYSQKLYANSDGLSLESASTRFYGGFELNGRLDTSISSRLPDKITSTLIERIEPLSIQAKTLEQAPLTLKHERLPVFIAGGTELIDIYLLANISGMKILTGDSPFTIDDFRNHTSVAAENFNLNYDQTIPLHSSSLGFTNEGVTGQKFALIEKGRLTQPNCGLKAAQRLGFAPRVAGNSSDAIMVNIPNFDQISKTTPELLYIPHAMGMHTQNTILGTYSLPCPDALYFEKGQLIGHIKSVITGNFFDVLKSPDLAFVKSTLQDDPLLTFNTAVTLG